jgi:hypothetical protein
VDARDDGVERSERLTGETGGIPTCGQARALTKGIKTSSCTRSTNVEISSIAWRRYSLPETANLRSKDSPFFIVRTRDTRVRRNAMSDRAKSLAERIRRSVDAFAAAAASLPDEAWSSFVPAEEKSVAALVHHVAWALEEESAAFAAMAGGRRESGWTAEWLDARNREQAKLYANAPRGESLERLEQAARTAIARVSRMTDDALDRRGTHMPGEPERSVAGWIEACLIGHPLDHLPALTPLANGEHADGD